MIYNSHKIKDKKGFTLTELLVAIAIIAALGAVAFGIAPNFIKRLHQHELDKNAEILYSAIQNRLTELRVSGQESEYDADIHSEIHKFPSDYTFSNDSGQTYHIENMAYLIANESRERAEILLPMDRVDESLWVGNWVVEFNYKSGTVWGVFYIEGDTSYRLDQSFNDLRTSFDARMDQKIGYYGKGTANLNPGTKTYSPTVKITNGEELTAEFSCPDVADDDGKDFYFWYTITELDNNDCPITSNYHSDKIVANDDDNDGVFTATLTLDSLKVGEHFSRFKELTPGRKMRLEFTWGDSETPEGDASDSSYEGSNLFNSLFADDTSVVNGEALLKYGRHLQNLDTSTSNVADIITKAKLGADISFGGNSEWHKVYETDGIRTLKPITNENLSTFDGDGKTIQDMKAYASTNGAGLFGAFYGREIKNLTLEGPVVKDAEDKKDGSTAHVGILAGQVLVPDNSGDTSFSSIENITITKATGGDYPTVSSYGGNAGGLIGIVNPFNSTSTNKATLKLNNISIEATINVTADLLDVDNTEVYGHAGGIIGGIGKSDKLTVQLNKIKINDNNEEIVQITSKKGNAGGFIGNCSAKVEIIGDGGTSENKPATFNVNVGSTYGNAGGVLGFMSANGSIYNVSLKGASVVAVSGSAGGVVGLVSDAVNSDTDIYNIVFDYSDDEHSTDDNKLKVTSTNQYAGGLIGYLMGSPDIGNKTGDVLTLNDISVSAGLGAGGLIGCIASTPEITNCKITNSEIRGLVNGNAGGFVGVVSEQSNSNTHISNGEINSVNVLTSGGAAGGLVGVAVFPFGADNITVTDAKVISSSYSEENNTTLVETNDTGYAGGFVGEVRADVNVNNYYCYCTSTTIQADKIVIPKTGTSNLSNSYVYGGTASGGLVGAVTSGTLSVDKSFASTIIGFRDNNPSKSSGGLIGSCDGNASITKSYADSYVFGQYAGGLVGQTSDSAIVSISVCYAAGYLYGCGDEPIVAGISCGYLQVKGNSYTVCCPKMPDEGKGIYYSTTKEKLSGDDGAYIYFLFEGTDSSNDITERMVQYMWSSDTATRNKFATLLGSNFTSDGSSTEYDINQSWGYHPSNSYPYPKIKSISEDVGVGNIGDWEEYVFSGMQTRLVYFEKYKNGSYGIYYKDINGVYQSTLTLDTLTPVCGDGYGILSERWDIAGNVSLTVNESSSKWNFASTLIPVTTIDGKEMILRVIPPEELEKACFSSTLFCSGKFEFKDCYINESSSASLTIIFNPRAAKTIRDNAPDKKETIVVAIRTSRQLWALSQTYSHYNEDENNFDDVSYVQQLNLDYNDYQWNYYTTQKKDENTFFIQKPIGGDSSTKTIQFARTYNGQCYEIRNVSFSESGDFMYAGMFAYLTGKAENIFLVNTYRDNTKSAPIVYLAGRVGVLAGQSSGTIDNCAVCGYDLKYLSVPDYDWRCIGGLIGYNTGTVSNCSVSIRNIVYVPNEAQEWKHIYIGGFIGYNEGNVSQSYAIGSVGHKNVTQYLLYYSCVSGFIGRHASGQCSNCYCMVGCNDDYIPSILPQGTWYGFTTKGGNLNNCDYLNLGKKESLLSLYGSPGQKYKQTYPDRWPDWYHWDAGTARTLADMKSTRSGSATSFYASTSDNYPYTAFVKDKKGNTEKLIHYGDWPHTTNETSVSMSSFNITASTDTLQMEEGETKTLYITATDADTNEQITSEISLSLSSTNGNIEIDNTPLDGDVVDDTTGKTIDEMTDLDTGEYPGALAFTCTALSTGPDSIQVDQDAVIDDFLDIYDPTAEEESNLNQSDTAPEVVVESVTELPTATGDTDSNQNEISEDSLTEFAVENQTSGGQESPSLIQESISSEEEALSNSDTIYILTEPLTLTANVYKSGHVGIVSIEKATFDSQVLASNDVVLPAMETTGTYQKEENSTGEFEFLLPYSEELENGNYNLLLYFARDASLETNSTQISIKNVSVTRHVSSATEFFDQTYELYNFDNSEVNSWNYENYFFKAGDTISGQNEDYMYMYLPITFTGRFADPVSISIVVSNGTETYCLSYDMDSVQNEFLISCIDGLFIKPIFEKTIAYGEPFDLPVQEDIDAFVASLNDEELQAYTENRRGYIYPTAAKDENGLEESIWSPKWAMIVYEDQIYELQRTPISYTISFDPNGGSGQMDSISAVYDELIDLPKCSFTKGSAVFKGWALSPDGEAEFLEDSYVYSLTDENQGEAILYAIWEDTAEPAEEEKETEKSDENETAETQESDKAEQTDTSSTSDKTEESDTDAKDDAGEQKSQTDSSSTDSSEDTQQSGDVSKEQKSSATDASNTGNVASETPTGSAKGSNSASDDTTKTASDGNSSTEENSKKLNGTSSSSDTDVATKNSSNTDIVNSGIPKVTDKTVAPETANGESKSEEEKKTPEEKK